MKYLKRHWLFLGIALSNAIAAIVFFCIDQDILWVICLFNAVIFSLNAELTLQDEKAKEQRQLIEALRRKVDALEGLIRAIEEREQLDYEYLKKRDDIIAHTVKKIETER